MFVAPSSLLLYSADWKKTIDHQQRERKRALLLAAARDSSSSHDRHPPPPRPNALLDLARSFHVFFSGGGGGGLHLLKQQHPHSQVSDLPPVLAPHHPACSFPFLDDHHVVFYAPPVVVSILSQTLGCLVVGQEEKEEVWTCPGYCRLVFVSFWKEEALRLVQFGFFQE